MFDEKIKLGSTYRDKISGFTGVATVRSEYLNGCTRVGLQPLVTEKDPHVLPDSVYFDDMQLELAKEIAHKPARETGGPRDNPKGPEDPR